MKPSMLLSARLRRFLLALAEVGHETNREIKLGLLAARRSVFIDVGANLGQFARFMAPLYDRVIVFEPIARFADQLGTILPQNCSVQNCALADVTGSATFYVPDEPDDSATQTATLVAPSAAGAHLEIDVRVARLDDFALADVSFVKIDVEGAEYDVLRGAVATLKRCRPVLLVEIEDRHTKGDSGRVFDLLSELGYEAFVLCDDARPRRSTSLARLLRGAALVAGFAKIPLVSANDAVAASRASGGDLNRAFGAAYVNNFLFLPRPSSEIDGRRVLAKSHRIELSGHGSCSGSAG